ncbi:hypothetical protein IMZ48_31590, partial [Candidatus Bathyarchaeota archaeon]|nr:hypothetical protein [Candidatus Bathyarchaeota archaeon]
MLTTDPAGPPYDQGRSSTLYNPRSKVASHQFRGQPRQAHPARSASYGLDSANYHDDYSHSPSHTSVDTVPMNGLVETAPIGAMYVRALYDYEADDRTSLSFHEGDVIQVINQLESGWWDGVINGVRGWFPSNYCQVVTSPEELPDHVLQAASVEGLEDEVGQAGTFVDDFDEAYESDDGGADGGLPLEGADNGDTSRSDFWIPQATPDGRLFYYNMMTGDRSTELPLESPRSSADTGPRDRSGTNVSIPDRTRPPPEMMARGGMTTDEEDSDTNSASELDGENLINNPRHTLVRNQNSFHDTLSPSTSMDSINGVSPVTRNPRGDPFGSAGMPPSQPPTMASATSFTMTPYGVGSPPTQSVPRSFFDDGQAPPLTWTRLVQSMKRAIDRYREAITSNRRSEYVARAEDISDHLRLLLAAGSGTTDNHSGQPS